MNCRNALLGIIVLSSLALAAGVHADTSGFNVRLHKDQDRQRTRLEGEQRQYRNAVGDLPPGEQRQLDRRLQQQQLKQRQLQKQQRRDAQTRRHRSDPGLGPSSRAEQGIDRERARRGQESQRLKFKSERGRWGYRNR